VKRSLAGSAAFAVAHDYQEQGEENTEQTSSL